MFCAVSMTASRLLQFGEIFVRRLRLFGHGLADAARHAVKPFADRLIEFGLPRTKQLGHGLHPALHLRLALQDFAHPRLSIARPVFCLYFSNKPHACRAPHRDTGEKNDERGYYRCCEQRRTQRYRTGTELKQCLIE